MQHHDNLDGLKITDKLVFDLQLALYLDLVALLEHSGVVSYRQMAARVLNLSLSAREEGDGPLGDVLEGIAGGFAGQGEGLSIGVLKAANALRNDEAMGDIPSLPEDN
ncbi:hypothetical protein [Variovorax sp.]|uniref:hypothetical protein n=1 Tax=Variovorax sp. TaxID=1871043 RepID=UPI002D564FEB|nr:hypothetical protein [Variovorax sp.]HYP82607.1 hypothetical protein [Variovorax sp.]